MQLEIHPAHVTPFHRRIEPCDYGSHFPLGAFRPNGRGFGVRSHSHGHLPVFSIPTIKKAAMLMAMLATAIAVAQSLVLDIFEVILPPRLSVDGRDIPLAWGSGGTIWPGNRALTGQK